MFRSNNKLKDSEQSNIKYILGLFVVFVCCELLLNPIGDFPLNDDWFYAKALKTIQFDSYINNAHWGYASMLTHLFYGKLVTTIFGFSYNVLRMSTLILSFTGITFFYFLVKEYVGMLNKQAFLATLIVMADPLFLSLSNSYMTDVPFITSIMMAVYFYLKFKRSNKLKYYCLSVLLLIWALLIRQLALAFIIGLFFSDIILEKKITVKNMLLITLSLLVLYLFERWLYISNANTGYAYLFFRTSTTARSITVPEIGINFLKRWIHYVSFSGFVLFPILLTYLYHYIKQKLFFNTKKQFIISLILMIPVSWSLRKFPIGNYLYNCGIGPDTLYDTYILGINSQHAHDLILFGIIRVLAFTGSFSLLLVLIQFVFKVIHWRTTDVSKHIVLLILIISLFFYYSFLAIASPIFDRYIMIFSILIIPIIFYIYNPPIKEKIIVSILIVLLMLFSVFATKDYFNGHRTIWKIINELKQTEGLTDTDINGGLEHCASSFGDSAFWFKKWNNIPENKYVITRGKLINYHVYKSYYYQRYIPLKTDTIFVLAKNEK